ncbi:Integral membrane protein possibly involved in chromosome condensation [Saccharomonospora marina XMU15]|uniref:Fluoride-specific ion channel FluC n=1 Tax=Saccharomonospora marina XMU15 TaxID=882083 RepID=H5WWL3_9PSEU|nr:CrcB family protein [Saccharomonospora marina]EHR50569.1 Integral membrane protein possibly involved in chromosome condensation [Saccharomonospora marina XMU15]
MRRAGQWDVLLVIAVGGALGSLARYGLAVALPHPPGDLALSTLLANVLGCLLIGVLMVVISQLAQPHRLLRPFLGIGVLGGFTTFSTYVVDAMYSVLQGRPGLAIGYAVGSVLASLFAVAAGMLVTRAVIRRAGQAGGA